MPENRSPEASEALKEAFLAYGESLAPTPAPSVHAPLAERAIKSPLNNEETSAVGDMITPSGETPEQVAARVLKIGEELAKLRQSDFTLAA